MKRTASLPELFAQAYDDVLSADVPVPTYDKIRVLFNQKIGSYWGLTKKLRNENASYQIQLSQRLCNDTDDRSIKNTIAHELIHCAGVHGHKGLFLIYANCINRKFPGYYHVSRCTSDETKLGKDGIMESYKYVIKCPKCGKLWGYDRKMDRVVNPQKYHCATCFGPIVRAK